MKNQKVRRWLLDKRSQFRALSVFVLMDLVWNAEPMVDGFEEQHVGSLVIPY